MITQQRLKELLSYNPDTGVFVWNISPSWGTKAGTTAGAKLHRGRRYIRICRKQYAASRLAFLYIHGYIPNEVDHVDLDKSNNRIGNLRACTRSQNKANQRKYVTNTSGYKGVTLRQGRWNARISVGYKRISLGSFNTSEEAHAAYAKAASAYFGDFARST